MIPLLVTDNFESSLHADTLEQLRELSARIASAGRRTSLLGAIRSRFSDTSNTLTRNLNGLMTVTQVAGNSIQVRLGAMYGNRVDAMIPRTYGVTLLVLFPTAAQDRHIPESTLNEDIIPCAAATFTADTFFRDGRSGRVVRRTTDEDAWRAIRNVAPGTSWEVAQRWLEAVREDDFEKFQRDAGGPRRATELWSRLVATLSTASTSRGRFQAPFRDVQFFTTGTKGSVLDDGEYSHLLLIGGRNLVPDRIAGTLHATLKVPASGGTAKEVVLHSTRVEVTNDGRASTISFPSLHKLVKGENVDTVKAQVEYQPPVRDWQTGSDANARSWVWSSDSVSYVPPLEPPKEEKEKPAAKFTMQTTAEFIYAKRNTGSVWIALKHAADTAKFPMHFSVSPGVVVRVDPDKAIVDGISRSLVEDGVYRLDLDNLTVGSKVTIKSWRVDETNVKNLIYGDAIILEVRERR